MPLKSGTRLGPYEIVSSLGAGGMGEVYRARDTRLGRFVAIKILRADISANANMRQRFEREARAVSSLNHPHICALYDLGREDGVDFLVLEHLEGETLADRMRKGALPLDESLRIATEIFAALDVAHRCGVVHRDLKPGNVMLTKLGAKLLDFGLARLKPVVPASVPSETAAMPSETVDQALTAEATVLGTLPYMSPEQFEGKEADARSDIFSAGIVMYEMTAGRRPFEGSSSAALMAAILKSEPSAMSRDPSSVPRALDRLVHQCLAKHPDERWQSAHDVGLELRMIRELVQHPEAAGAHDARSAHGSARRSRRGWIAAAAAAGLAAVTLGVLLFRERSALTANETIRFSIDAPEGMSIEEPFWSQPRVSPNGRAIAFVASDPGERGIWIRPLDALSPTLLPGTEGGYAPFWSPDSRLIAFFAEGKLKAILAANGAPRTVCDVPGVAACGTWGSAGTIVFGIWEAPGHDGLYRVSASGGDPSRMSLRDAERGELASAFYPSFLPDGNRYLFFAVREDGEPGIYFGRLDAEVAEHIPHERIDSRVEYAAPGYLLGLSENALLAQPFDAKRGRLEGSPVSLAENVMGFAYSGAFSASDNGVLAFQPLGGAYSQLAWFDRTGHMLGPIGEAAVYYGANLSPDGTRIAVQVDDPREVTSSVMLLRFPEGAPTRLTRGASDVEGCPIWSPDGREIAFSRARNQTPHVVKMAIGDPDAEIVAPHNGHVQWPCDWSPDGSTIIYTDRDPSTWSDLWCVRLDGDRTPVPWLQTRFREGEAKFSPNGHWVAYASDETGRSEVYIRAFQGSGETRRVSNGGGRTPRWRGDGAEIYYLDLGEEPVIVAAGIDASSGEPTSVPRTLFRVSAPVRDFDVTKDGQRFLLNSEVPASSPTLVNVVVNWTAGFAP